MSFLCGCGYGFKTSSFVEDALEKIVRHNIYGYYNIQHGDGYFDAVKGWMKRHHDWDVKEEWHVITPGVVFAIAVAIRAFTDPGDPVLIQQPVYYPFEMAMENVRNESDALSACYDVVYDDHFVKIKVKSVNESRIVLVVEGGMVEPNDDGTIDLGAEPIEKLELDCGQSIELVSTSVSAGFNLVISYEQNQNVIVH